MLAGLESLNRLKLSPWGMQGRYGWAADHGFLLVVQVAVQWAERWAWSQNCVYPGSAPDMLVILEESISPVLGVLICDMGLYRPTSPGCEVSEEST